MQIKLMLLLLLLLRIMGIKHFYDFSFKKDYSILYEIRKGKKQGHGYSLTQKFFASSHTPHPNSPQVPPPRLPAPGQEHAFSLNSTLLPGGRGILNFRYVNLALLPMLAHPHWVNNKSSVRQLQSLMVSCMVKSSLLTAGTTAAFNYLKQEILLLGQRKGF